MGNRDSSAERLAPEKESGAAEMLTETVEYRERGLVAVLTVQNPPVNALSHSVRIGLMEGLKRAAADDRVKAVVLIGGGRTYMAGADLKEFGRPKDPPELHHVQAAMEALPKHIVSAIHGTALGGGLEVALTGHWRIATADARLGLPEIKLGLMPGAGGNQRLTRLIGPQGALELILTGDPISAQQALALGIIDAIADGDLLGSALDFAERVVAEGRLLQVVRQRRDKITGIDPQLFRDYRAKVEQSARGLMAPQKIIDCIEAACTRSTDQAFAFDAKSYQECLDSPQRKAMIHLFFAERATRKLPDLPTGMKGLPVHKIAVVGADPTGCAIAMRFADAGISVRMIDVSSDAVAGGLKRIRESAAVAVAAGRSQEAAERAAKLVEGFSSYQAIGDVDLLVDASFDDIELKASLFRKLDAIAPPHCIFACSTASLDIDAIAAATGRPAQVIGLHFLQAAGSVRALEVVAGKASAMQSVVTGMDLGGRLGLATLFVRAGGVGLVGERMLQRYVASAERLVEQGCSVAHLTDVTQAFGLALAPFDIGGLRARAAVPAGGSDLSAEEVLARLLHPVINEGAKILEEGVALRAADIDVLWVRALGFPQYHGGPMFWGEQQGLRGVLATVHAMGEQFGGGWGPCALLQALVQQGKGFSSQDA